jgi:hypothetical protein
MRCKAGDSPITRTLPPFVPLTVKIRPNQSVAHNVAFMPRNRFVCTPDGTGCRDIWEPALTNSRKRCMVWASTAIMPVGPLQWQGGFLTTINMRKMPDGRPFWSSQRTETALLHRNGLSFSVHSDGICAASKMRFDMRAMDALSLSRKLPPIVKETGEIRAIVETPRQSQQIRFRSPNRAFRTWFSHASGS